jgi:hypothetical protein
VQLGERQLEGINAAKVRGVYKGRKPSIDAVEVVRLRREEKLGPAAIARGSASAGRASIVCWVSRPLPSRRTEVSMPIKPEMRGYYPIDWPESAGASGSSAQICSRYLRSSSSARVSRAILISSDGPRRRARASAV